MLDELQRQLEIGGHRERLQTVRQLGEMTSREAYELLELAAEDVDPQIRGEAMDLMRNSRWFTGFHQQSSSGDGGPGDDPCPSLF